MRVLSVDPVLSCEDRLPLDLKDDSVAVQNNRNSTLPAGDTKDVCSCSGRAVKVRVETLEPVNHVTLPVERDAI